MSNDRAAGPLSQTAFPQLGSALHQLREQFLTGQLDATAERRERLSIAADALKAAYETDNELTAFTTLDREGSRITAN